MAKLTIGIRSAMVIMALIALAVAVAIQGRALMEQGRRVVALEAQTRRLQAQNVQGANMMNKAIMIMNKNRSDDLKRLDKLERDVAGHEVAPVKP